MLPQVCTGHTLHGPRLGGRGREGERERRGGRGEERGGGRESEGEERGRERRINHCIYMYYPWIKLRMNIIIGSDYIRGIEMHMYK